MGIYDLANRFGKLDCCSDDCYGWIVVRHDCAKRSEQRGQ
jgi:hypothetical protein